MAVKLAFSEAVLQPVRAFLTNKNQLGCRKPIVSFEILLSVLFSPYLYFVFADLYYISASKVPTVLPRSKNRRFPSRLTTSVASL